MLGGASVSESFQRRALREVEPGDGGDLNFWKFPYCFMFSFRFDFEIIQF